MKDRSEDKDMMIFELIGMGFVMLLLAVMVTGSQVPSR